MRELRVKTSRLAGIGGTGKNLHVNGLERIGEDFGVAKDGSEHNLGKNHFLKNLGKLLF